MLSAQSMSANISTQPVCTCDVLVVLHGPGIAVNSLNAISLHPVQLPLGLTVHSTHHSHHGHTQMVGSELR